MIRKHDKRQPTQPGFESPFERSLSPNNRWIKLAEVVPWDEFATAYYSGMCADHGAPAKPARLDELRWEAFNEGADLTGQVEAFKKRHGHYPAVVLADGIYGTRDNRCYCKEKGIRFGGKPLGRPKKETEANREELREAKKQRRRDHLERIPIEGKFGQGKNRHGLAKIRAKLAGTSAS